MEKDNFNANVDFVRGQADMIVLSALSDTDKYGLEILSAIQERSQGMYSLKQATLYSSLKRLEKNGYVHSYDGDISNGAKRVYYGLTQMGREHLENDKSYWEFCNFLMSNLISDNKFDPQSEDKPFDPADFRPLTRRARGEKEDKEQDKEKEVVVKYVYLKSDDIPEGADIVYVSPENIQEINNKTENVENAQGDSDLPEQEETLLLSQTETQEITTLSGSGDEYQPSFILINDVNEEVLVEDNQSNEEAIEEHLIDEVAEIENADLTESDAEVIEETALLVPQEEQPQNEEGVNFIIAEETEEVAQIAETSDEMSAVSAVEDNDADTAENLNEAEESVIESTTEEVIEEVQEENLQPIQDNSELEQTQSEDYETATSTFASRPLHNPAQDPSTSFSSIFSNYSRENDVNYVESFSELFDVEDEDDSFEQETSTDIEFLTMKEMVYKYQAKGVNIKPYDKRNTMEYYVNRYYFSNKLQFHASLIIFVIFAVELFISHFICNRGENKISNLWLLIIFALAIFPAIRSVMYVIDPTRKSLANYNPKTSFLISLLPVVTMPIVFALLGFVEFSANINDYMSMERTIILPSVLLFNIPLFSIIYTLLYRTYKYHVN
ncbi:MAG: helix-turn-helix transcriptional regulator [Clostridia bacterium]|nr:helix-turn-helix transcriptional regulator [Clostridia bacterium]